MRTCKGAGVMHDDMAAPACLPARATCRCMPCVLLHLTTIGFTPLRPPPIAVPPCSKWMQQQMQVAAHWGSYTYNKDERDLVAVGAACGVCTAFKAPVSSHATAPPPHPPPRRAAPLLTCTEGRHACGPCMCML